MAGVATFIRHFEIDRSSGSVGVSQLSLDVIQAAAIAQRMTGVGMPEGVRCKSLYTGLSAMSFKCLPNPPVCEQEDPSPMTSCNISCRKSVTFP